MHQQETALGLDPRGKARAPYEFSCKVSIATPVTQPKGRQFVLHAKALHGNPFDGHTLGPMVANMQRLTGIEVRRIHVDKGYRGHNASKFRVWISGQVRRTTPAIRREMKRRAAVEPVIGHVKAHQCRARRRRLQLQPAPALARGTLACPHRGARRTRSRASNSVKITTSAILHSRPAS